MTKNSVAVRDLSGQRPTKGHPFFNRLSVFTVPVHPAGVNPYLRLLRARVTRVGRNNRN